MLTRARGRYPPFGVGDFISRWAVTSDSVRVPRQIAGTSIIGLSFTNDIAQRDLVISQRMRHELNALGDPI